jgi:SAM-dependent methyltransferase
MNKAKHVAYYDMMFEAGGHGGVYDLPYRQSCYWPLHCAVLKEIRRLNSKAVLEVGCGTGAFAHLLMDNLSLSYVGFDFSAIAVKKARLRTHREHGFFVGDALNAASYNHAFDSIVCTEVLEHIDKDLEAIGKWPAGCQCICSVPNFDADSHVRFFTSTESVLERYGQAIAIERIARIRKPILADISWSNYVRALRWYRYRPRQLLAALGVGTFRSLGGWFLFSGRKR